MMKKNVVNHKNKKTHILMLTTDSEVCGTEQIILSLLRHLDRERFDASLVTLFGPGDLCEQAQQLGYPAYNLRLKEVSKFHAFVSWWKLVRTLKPDIIQSLLIHSNLLGRITTLFNRRIAMLGGISTVYTVEGYGRLYAWIERYTHFLDILYVVNSELGMKNVFELIRLPHKKVTLVHNGIEISENGEHNQEKRKTVRQEFGFQEKHFVIGIIAQLRPAKRHDLLIRAIAQLKHKYPHIRLLIVGQGEMLEKMKDLACQEHVVNEVLFAGYRSDARSILQGLDLFALPSDVEGEPVSLMEAMDASLPIVASATGGIPEIMQEGETGLLIPPGNLNKLCAALETMIIDEEKRTEMGQQSRRRVAEHFSAARMTRQFEELYESCYRIKNSGQ